VFREEGEKGFKKYIFGDDVNENHGWDSTGTIQKKKIKIVLRTGTGIADSVIETLRQKKILEEKIQEEINRGSVDKKKGKEKEKKHVRFVEGLIDEESKEVEKSKKKSREEDDIPPEPEAKRRCTRKCRYIIPSQTSNTEAEAGPSSTNNSRPEPAKGNTYDNLFDQLRKVSKHYNSPVVQDPDYINYKIAKVGQDEKIKADVQAKLDALTPEQQAESQEKDDEYRSGMISRLSSKILLCENKTKKAQKRVNRLRSVELEPSRKLKEAKDKLNQLRERGSELVNVITKEDEKPTMALSEINAIRDKFDETGKGKSTHNALSSHVTNCF